MDLHCIQNRALPSGMIRDKYDPKNRSRSTVFENYLLVLKKTIINICKLLSRNNKYI